MSGETVMAWLGPLQFLEADEPRASMPGKSPTLEEAMGFICPPGISSDIDSLVSRYRRISNDEPRLWAVPAEQRIVDKLALPLRHAKAGYMIGNYLGTMALCGTVAEMIAMLWFEISHLRINGKGMTDEEQKLEFGCTFEKLGQQRRVKELLRLTVIDSTTKSLFDLIRTTRRKYLHLWSQDHESLPPDSIEVFRATVNLMAGILGQDVRDGKFILDPAILEYLKRTGVYHESDESEDMST